MAGGRPTKYNPDNNILVEGWARDGLSNEQIAANLGVNVATLYEWRLRHPEFAESIKKGKEVADREVENALHQSALSGNIVAQIFWLKNRKPGQWRDKQDVEHSGGLEIKVKLPEDLVE